VGHKTSLHSLEDIFNFVKAKIVTHNMMVVHCIQNKEIISDEFYEYAHDLGPAITNASVTSKEGKAGLF
jgi:hypothetical protein